MWKPMAVIVGALLAPGVLHAESHLSQKVENHVVLSRKTESVFQGCDPFRRVFPNNVDIEFQLKRGELLVVTDVYWQSELEEDDLAASLRIQLGPSGDLAVYHSQTLDVVAPGHRVGGSEHLTTGFVVGPQAAICAYVFPTYSLFDAPINNLPQSIILQGYLTKGRGSPLVLPFLPSPFPR